MGADGSTSRASTVDEPAVSVPARAALAGNPSDGHGGAVVAVPLACWSATAVAHDGPFEVVGAEPGDDLWELAAAACRSLVTTLFVDAEAPMATTEVRLELSTTIPRSVGLAGSSALVLAVLRAIASRAVGAPDGRPPWRRQLDDPDAFAVVAHQAEVAELGIAAGMQDRLVQAHRVPVYMDFSPAASRTVLGHPCGSVRHLASPPGRWVVAHRRAAAESSGVVHAGLARRSDTGSVMADLAAAAQAAATAIDNADVDALGAAMDRTFELRAELLDLDPRHVAMVEAVRRGGGHANYTGSGGAVIAMCTDHAIQHAVANELAALDGCEVQLDPLHGA